MAQVLASDMNAFNQNSHTPHNFIDHLDRINQAEKKTRHARKPNNFSGSTMKITIIWGTRHQTSHDLLQIFMTRYFSLDAHLSWFRAFEIVKLIWICRRNQVQAATEQNKSDGKKTWSSIILSNEVWRPICSEKSEGAQASRRGSWYEVL